MKPCRRKYTPLIWKERSRALPKGDSALLKILSMLCRSKMILVPHRLPDIRNWWRDTIMLCKDEFPHPPLPSTNLFSGLVSSNQEEESHDPRLWYKYDWYKLPHILVNISITAHCDRIKCSEYGLEMTLVAFIYEQTVAITAELSLTLNQTLGKEMAK